jgi:Ca2+-binding RTX toxin-like protein
MSNITINATRQSPIAPNALFSSLLEIDFNGATSLVFSATQTTSIRVKWWAPGSTKVAADKEYTFLPNTLVSDKGNVLIFGATSLLVKNPETFLLPLPGSYEVTLPRALFQGHTIANPVSQKISLDGAIANTTTKIVDNSIANQDFFIAIGSTADDRLIGGNKADFFEGGRGNDTIIGGGRNPLFSFSNGVLTASDGDGRARDIVFYNADRSHFVITKLANNEYTVRDTRVGSVNLGTDTLKDIDLIVFKSDQLRPAEDEYRYMEAVELNIDVGLSDGGGHLYYIKGSFTGDVINQAAIALAIDPANGEQAQAAAKHILDRSSWIDGGNGDDRIAAGSGRDSIYGGLGNDFIDGGINGRSLNDWNRVDQGEYDGPRSRFVITEHDDNASGTVTGVSALQNGGIAKKYFKVLDTIQDASINQGEDIYINTERLWFSEGENSGSHVNLVDIASFWVNTSQGQISNAGMNIQGSIFADDIKLSKYFDITLNRFYGSDWDLRNVGTPTLDSAGKLVLPDTRIWQSDAGTPYYNADFGPRYYLKTDRQTDLIDNFWGNLGSGNDRFEFDVVGFGGGINTGAGDDVVIGLAKDRLPSFDNHNSWQDNISVNYDGAFKRYQVSQGIDNDGSLTGIANAAYLKVVDLLPAGKGGSGTDYLVNVDNLNFSDRNLNTSINYWQQNAWSWDGSRSIEIPNSGVSANGSVFSDVIGPGPSASAALIDFFAGDDNLNGNQGDDELYGGAGTDTLRGGAGNDYLDGGIETRRDITRDINWSSGGHGFGDVAEYSGNRDRYTIIDNNNGTFTVRDSKLNGDGEDTLVNIEVIRFNDNQRVFLKTVSERENWWYNNTTGVQWKITGSIFGDRIEGNEGTAPGSSSMVRDWIDGGAGDDIIYAKGGSDYIAGGTGNDFIDGGTDGDASLNYWDRVDTAVFEGPSSRFVITRSDDRLIVRDKLSDSLGGLGTDTLVNIEKLQFSNTTIFATPQINRSIQSNNDLYIHIEGTDFGDQIDLSGSEYSGATWITINSGHGDDNLYLGSGGSGVNLKRGFDIVDGGEGDDHISMPAYRSRFDINKITYADLNSSNPQQAAVKEVIDGRYAINEKPDAIFVFQDRLPDALGGVGTKYLFNIESDVSFQQYREGETSFNLELDPLNLWRGTEFDDVIIAGSQFNSNSPRFYGYGGNDLFEVNGGVAGRYLRIEGGAGNDEVRVTDSSEVSVIYSGNYHRYIISKNGSTLTVEDTLPSALGSDGTDTLINVKTLEFSGFSFNVVDFEGITPPTRPILGTNDTFIADPANPYIYINQNPARFEVIPSVSSDGVNQIIVRDRLPSTTPGSLGEDTYIGYSWISFSNQSYSLKTNMYSWYNSWSKIGQVNYTGTIFNDVIEVKASDYQHNVEDPIANPVPIHFSYSIQGGVGDDVIFAGVGGSWINGGLGNDIIDGGPNGTTTDEWQNKDSVQLSSAYEFSKISKLSFAGTKETLAVLLNGQNYFALRAGLNSDTVSSIDRAINYLLTARSESGDRAFDSSGVLRAEYALATVIEDLTPSSLGGQGVDILFGIENIQFTDRHYQQSPNFNFNRWTSYEGTEVTELGSQGTDGADLMTLAEFANALGVPQSELNGLRINFNGREGDDTMVGGNSGDWFSPGAGNDVIDGGANTGNDRWGNPHRDSVQFDEKYERFDLIEVSLVKNGNAWVQNSADRAGFSVAVTNSGWVVTDVASSQKQLLQQEQRDAIAQTLERVIARLDPELQSVRINFVSDRLPAELSGLGTDALINVEQINFSNNWIQLRADPWYSRNEAGIIFHAGVNGTKSNDVLGKPVSGLDPAGYDWSGDDWMDGGAGDDRLFGGIGGDNLRGGLGDDYLDGGADGAVDQWGNIRGDTAQFSGSFASYTITQKSDGSIEVKDNSPDGDGTDTLVNIENLGFSDQWLNVQANRWINQDSNTGQIYNIHYNGSIFDETINHGSSIHANISADLNGNLGDDILIGGRASDYFRGGQGDDILIGGGSGLNQWGQRGHDTASFEGVFSRYTITTLTNGEVYSFEGITYTATNEKPILLVTDSIDDELGGNGVDTLIGIQRLNFADRNYSVSASTTSVDIDGDGRPDNSVIIGTDQADTLVGTALSDRIEGGAGNDTLSGLIGADYLIGGDGNDAIDGGDGIDTAEYVGLRSQYTINAINSVSFTVARIGGTTDGSDALSNVEKLKFADGTYILLAPTDLAVDRNKDGITDYTMRWGTDIFGDELNVSTSNQAFWLEGLAGNDTLVGGGLDDVLVGGLGDDILDGGAGQMNIAIINANLTTPTVIDRDGRQYFQISSDDGVDLLRNIQKVIFNDGEIYLDSESAVSSVLIDSDNDGLIDTQLHTGSTGSDTITGNLTLDNQFDLGAGNDSATGGSGSDHFIAGLGADVYNGGTNSSADAQGLGKSDYVWYSGNYDSLVSAQSDYTVTQESDGFHVVKKLDGNRVDVLRNIEQIIFANATLDIGIQSVSKAVWTREGIGREYIFTGSDFDDRFVSTVSKDTFTGNGGQDVFAFSGTTGVDTILDFEAGAGGDVLQFNTSLFANFDAVSQKMATLTTGTQIDLGNGNAITLNLVGIADLTADNFAFIAS